MRRGACVVLLLVSLLLTGPSASARSPHIVSDPDRPAVAAAARYLSVAGEPIAPLNGSFVRLEMLRRSIGGEHHIAQLRSALNQDVETFEFSYIEAVHDVTGDGADDALVVHIKGTITFGTDDTGFPTFSFDSKSTFSARHGRTGRELWTITKRASDGYVWIVEGSIGQEAEPGFFIVKDQDVSTSQPWTSITAIRGSTADPMWERRLDSTSFQNQNYVLPVTTTQNEPLITGVGNFLSGKADDLLIGLVTHANVGYYSTFFDTGVTVIDGRDGARRDHPERERSLNWLPLPWALGDQDDDGLHDYALGNNFGVVLRPGEEPGEVPDGKLGGVMRLRKGTTGAVIWEEGGLDLGQIAFAYSVGDQFGGSLPEFFILVFDYELTLLELPVPAPVPLPIGIGDITEWRELTYVMEGSGRVRFMKPIWMIHAPGRIDDDKEGDFIGWRVPFSRKAATVKLLAFNSHGEPLWKRTHRTPAPEGVCRNVCFSSRFFGAGSAGDLQPDGGKDLVFYVEAERADAKTVHHYTVDGLTGRKIHEGGEELFAAGREFDRRGADLLEIYRKNESVDIRTRSGTTGATLIETTIGSDLPAIRRDDIFWGIGDVTRDGCKDMLFTIMSTGGTYIVVLDGGSAEALWTEVLQGPTRKITTSPPKDLNRAC